MLYELQTYLEQLEKIGEGGSFSKQFDALFDVIFNDMSLYQIRTMGMQIPTSNEKIATNKNKMNEIHTKLYTSLHAFIELGKQEKIVRNDLPNNLILGLIFQTVNIPNTENIPHNQWVSKLKDMICHGIFTN